MMIRGRIERNLTGERERVTGRIASSVRRMDGKDWLSGRVKGRRLLGIPANVCMVKKSRAFEAIRMSYGRCFIPIPTLQKSS